MEAYDVMPDVITYNTLMNGCSATGCMIKCQQIFDDMVKAGIKPDDHTYNILAKGYVYAQEPEKAEEILSLMVDSGVQPNVVTFTTVICGWCSSTGSMDSAMRVFREMQKCGVFPNLKTFETLIWGYAEAKMPWKAEAIIKIMEDFNVLPEKGTFALIAEAWHATRQSKESRMGSAKNKNKVYPSSTENETTAEISEKTEDEVSFCYPKVLHIPREVISEHSQTTAAIKSSRLVLREAEISSGRLYTATKSVSLACKFGSRGPMIERKQYPCIFGQLPYLYSAVFLN